jgi:uncharacterized membrane protein SirB2
MYTILKTIHIASATLTICGYLLRAGWSFSGSDKLQMRVVRVLPHIIDTVFLLSGIGLILVMHLNVLQQDWLLAKLVALLAYIGFGMITLRKGLPTEIRAAAFIAALICFTYIVGAALIKSPRSWLQLF